MSQRPHQAGHHLTAVSTTAASFRLACVADVPALVALVNLAYRVEDFFIEGDRTDAADMAERLADGAFLLAESGDGGLDGCVHVTARGRHGHFGMLSVHPGAQRRGLGRALVTAAEEHCRARGCDDMSLEVVNLRDGLPGWYGRLGYRETGTAPFPAPDRLKQPCHFILMTRPLAARPLEATR